MYSYTIGKQVRVGIIVHKQSMGKRTYLARQAHHQLSEVQVWGHQGTRCGALRGAGTVLSEVQV